MTATGSSAAPGRSSDGRRALAALFWLLASLGVMLSGLTVWAHQTLLTSDGYGAIVKEVIADPEVVENVSTVLVTRISDRLGVRDTVADVLPGSLDVVAGALTAGVEDRIIGLVEDFISGEGFQEVFVEVNKTAHDAAMAVIRGGDSEALASQEGLVTLNIFPVLENVLLALQENGLIGQDREIPDLTNAEPSDQTVAMLERVLGRELPDDIGTIVLVDSENLALVQQVIRWFDLITLLSLAATILFTALALWLSERRIRMLMWLAFGAVAALALTRIVARLAFGGMTRRASEADASVTVLKIIEVALDSLLIFMFVGMVVALAVGVGAIWWERRSGPRPAMATPPRTLGQWLGDHAREIVLGGLAVIAFVVLWSIGGADLALTTGAAVGLLAIAYVLLTRGDAESEAALVAEAHGDDQGSS
jgi:hypothetical protein